MHLRAIQEPSMDIQYDRYSFVLDGQRTVIRSGAMHYFRLPSPQLWWDRLSKLKAAGYNTVDLYFCWGYHSSAQGEYDFTGIRDVDRLLDMVEALGLYLIARPGPYINAEYTGGGIPGWLLAKKDVVLRHRQPDGTFEWSPGFQEAVGEWWGQIVPRFAQRPNLLMMQIENEYATADMEPEYMEALYQMARDLGVKAPLSHNDLYAAGLYADIVDLYAFDNYSVTSFDTDWRGRADSVFSVLDHLEDNLRPFAENRPLIVAELQAGWFGTWKGVTYGKIVESLSRDHIRLATRTVVAQGLTVFNHYKAIGGTNWGLIGSTDTYTSYDFGAPISEAGLTTERLYEAKALNLLLDSFPLSATDKVQDPPVQVQVPSLYYSTRQIVPGELSGESLLKPPMWLFFRNLTSHESTTQVEAVGEYGPFSLTAVLKPYEMVILPLSVPLLSGYTLLFSSVEPVYQSSTLLFIRGDRPWTVFLGLPKAEHEVSTMPRVRKGHASLDGLDDQNGWRIAGAALGSREFTVIDFEGLTVVVLGSHWVDTLWVSPNGSVVMGPEEALPEGYFGVRNPQSPGWIFSPKGALFPLPSQDKINPPPPIPALNHWQIEAEGIHRSEQRTEAFESSGQLSQRVQISGLDFDANQLYEGTAWYRWIVPQTVSCPPNLTLDARHVWALFVNGRYMQWGTHLVLTQGQGVPEPETLQIPDALWKVDGPNEVMVLVDGLGHPKGFHDDGQEAQGLLKFEASGEPVSAQLSVMSAYRTPNVVVPGDGSASPVVTLTTSFSLSQSSEYYQPLGLVLEGLPYERINIYLNGMLLGRDWKQCQRQEKYYLPAGVLKRGEGEEGVNTLTLLCMNFDPLILPQAAAPPPGSVRLEPYGDFTKLGPLDTLLP